VTPGPAVTGPVTGGQYCAQAPVHFDEVAVSGANEYRVNPRALVTTVTPPIVAVFSAAPDPAAPDPAVPDAEAEALVGVPLPALVPEDELEHAVAPIATAAIPAAATILIRIDDPFRGHGLPAPVLCWPLRPRRTPSDLAGLVLILGGLPAKVSR
jgi:hypothetical protein